MSAAVIALVKKRLNELDRELDYKAPIFGWYWDKKASPELIRTHDAQGMVANIGIDGQYVRNDFDSAPIFGQMGEVVDNYGNHFIRIPRFYIRKTDGPDFKTLAVTTRPLPGFYLPWCFWDFERQKPLPYLDFGRFKGSLSEDAQRLESKPGTHPLVNRSIVQFRNLARANNTGGLRGYQQLGIHAVDVLRTLIFIEYVTLDMQSVMVGFTEGQFSSSHTAVLSESQTNRIVLTNANARGYRRGQSIGIGSSHTSNSVSGGPRLITEISEYDEEHTAIYFDGDPIDITEGDVVANRGWINGFSEHIAASSGTIVANDGKYPCVYRGIESPYGDIWQWVDGVNITDHQAWVCLDAEQYASNVFAAPYEKLAYANHNGNGYVKTMGFDPRFPYVEFPVEVGGSASTHYSDYYYQNTGSRVAHFGGSWTLGRYAGPSAWDLAYSSGPAYVSFGGRLLKKPL